MLTITKHPFEGGVAIRFAEAQNRWNEHLYYDHPQEFDGIKWVPAGTLPRHKVKGRTAGRDCIPTDLVTALMLGRLEL